MAPKQVETAPEQAAMAPEQVATAPEQVARSPDREWFSEVPKQVWTTDAIDVESKLNASSSKPLTMS